jgi:DNA-binding CsgD family transcriptional regulator
MVILASELSSNIETAEKPSYWAKQIQGTHSQHSKQSSLLQGIIEGLADGVLVLTTQGEWVYANEHGRRLCHQLSQGTSASDSISQAIVRTCEIWRDCHASFSPAKMVVDQEIRVNKSISFRMRVQWLVLEESAQPYLLVTLEDQNQSRKMQAIADAKKYGLTRREAEVWSLHQSRFSYKEIATKLYITPNTVKKHMKNIYAKQQNYLKK